MYINCSLLLCFYLFNIFYFITISLTSLIQWNYFDNKIFAETSANYTNNIFSNTYGITYTYTANDVGTGNFYLILVQNGDYQNAKAFSYVLTAGNDNSITIDKEGSFVLGSDIKLYNLITGK